MKNVLVTDTKYRMSLSPIWELAGKGYAITAVDYEDVPANERLGFYSRFVSGRELLNDETFCRQIEKIAKENRPVLLPGNRRSLEHMIDNKDVLTSCCDFLIPDRQSLEMADDKRAMYRVAQKIGVPVPCTTSLSEHESVSDMADGVRYPCIIKYRNGEVLGKKPADRYAIVHDRDTFIRTYERMQAIDPNPIASDYIEGHDLGVAVIMSHDHELVDFLCYESLREYPIEGGPTCFLKTIYSKKLLEYSVHLLKEIQFTGIAMLDFKGTPEDPYFLEINPRLWGSAAITYVSRSSFFESYVKAAQDIAEPMHTEGATPQYVLGRKMRFTPQAVACFAAHMKHSSHTLQILLQYIKSLLDPTVRDGLFTLRDPMPYVKYIQNLIRRR